MKNEKIPVSLQVIVSREDKWFVASCPLLDIATQGETEQEVKENIRELIEEYFNDPDTKKPTIDALNSSSVSVFSVPINLESSHGKTTGINSE